MKGCRFLLKPSLVRFTPEVAIDTVTPLRMSMPRLKRCSVLAVAWCYEMYTYIVDPVSASLAV